MLDHAAKRIDEDRVLFGSDFSVNCPATVIARVKNAYITEGQKRKILAGNLQALLKRVQA
jgi:predicted TIM-barrel fold metal-dependent hydrolase